MRLAPSASSRAVSFPCGAREVQVTGGFWGKAVDKVRHETVPSMLESLTNPEVSPCLTNFLIAAAQEDGAHDGPPFLDADLYKWLESAISLCETNSDPALESAIDRIRTLLADVQREDGYIHTPTLIRQRQHEDSDELADRFNFETYNLGHFITALVRDFETNGSHLSLELAQKAAAYLQHLADDSADTLARSAICPSHYMAVIELYRATGEPEYLELSRKLLRVREEFQGSDDNQDRVSVYQQRVIVGQAVRANYLYAGLTDYLLEAPDAELQDAITAVWEDAIQHKLYLTGGCGALYDGASPYASPNQSEISRVHQAYGAAYQLPNATAHNETCANIGMVLWSERLLALTGEARYADLIERILYNAVLPAMSLDGRKFFYTNPLRQVRDLPYPLRMPGDTALDPVPPPPPSDERQRTEYMSVFCCPPNLARTIAQFHERVFSHRDNRVWVNQYCSAKLELPCETGTLALEMATNYPWDGSIVLTIPEAPSSEFTLSLRVPQWCKNARMTDPDGNCRALAPGFHDLTRQFKAGDSISLELDMPPTLMRAHRLAEEVSNQAAVVRGPLVYCLESKDLPSGVNIEDVALRANASMDTAPGMINQTPMLLIQTTGKVLPSRRGPDLYEELPDEAPADLPVSLIPYFAWGNRGPSEMSVWLPLAW